MNNTVLKNNEDFLTHPFKTLMSNFISQYGHDIKITDVMVSNEKHVDNPDVLDEEKQERRKLSRNRRKNQDRRISNNVNYIGHARRLNIDRREVFRDRRVITD